MSVGNLCNLKTWFNTSSAVSLAEKSLGKWEMYDLADRKYLRFLVSPHKKRLFYSFQPVAIRLMPL